MTWHAALQQWLDQDRKRAWLEDVIVRAGLANVVSWQAAQRMLEAMDDDSYTCTSRACARARVEAI